MAKSKKTCPECDGELLEDGACPTCGPSEGPEKEETEKEANLETEEEPKE